ncbi:MAG TPA: NAD(P)-dependent oxidoreductase [Phenylobacterium sp.]|jgi:3-hydroxyisobutyrate dehydrogenase-like beta-hydroxyacid dehydrogenase|uniref:NAD(P)-dependent oxidoreductase n=1 Tax=Phenylobacterium sp. TaxID=1871053 RepID=UPI002CED9279|nr:NAD(P)-dependent oxidoreductase [Phenylobacterium sp.]HXA37945.1 NAD(P)-dependent oxidoreductase [Phenylobacterium sp.]
MPGHARHAADPGSVRDRPAAEVRETVGGAPSERTGSAASGVRLAAQGEIGFVGLGRMGAAMAANLAADGGRVVAYVRAPEQMEKLATLGIRPTTNIADLFGCRVVISMLPDDAAVGNVVFGGDGVRGLGTGLQPGAIHLSMSTISTAAASRLAGEHARLGQGYVAAPVFGNPQAAQARQLFVIAAGDPADIDCCQPILDSLSQRTFVVGDHPWHANLIKLLGNMMSATALEMMSEAVAVFLKRGLDPQLFIDVMTNTMFGGRAHRIYGDKIASQSYAPGFVLPLVLKDVRLALAEAECAGSPMPSVGVVRDRLITGLSRGYADLDWSALGLIAAEEAGLYLVPPLTVG